jgi:NAD(P)H-flavin reductase
MPTVLETSQHAAPIDPMVPVPFRVKRYHKETRDTYTLELVPADERVEFNFAPGQFNMLYLFGVGEVPISISGDPGAKSPLVHTIRAVGSVTRAMQNLRAGDTVGVRGPFGTPWPMGMADQRDVVIAAGGIGLAPVRPVIYQLLANRDRYGKVVLLYGTRTPEDILYRQELERWRARFDLEVHVTVDRGTTGWRGDVGVVTTLIPKIQFDSMHTLAIICGPEIMMRFTAFELLKRGVWAEKIYISMERNMKCGIGLCGYCQCGRYFICKDGPVFRYDRVKEILLKREI